jgi:hypothetical protein
MNSNLYDRLISNPPANSKANLIGKDKTPIDADKEPFKGSRDLVKDEKYLVKSRGGELGSHPTPPAGYKAPGYANGDKEYTKLFNARTKK